MRKHPRKHDRATWRVCSLVVPAISLLMLKACNPFSAADSPDDDTSKTDAGPSVTPSLACPYGCLPPAPSGWSGPSAVYVGSPDGKPTGCSTPYPRAEVEAHDKASAAPAECTCLEGDASAGACSVTGTTFARTGCAGAQQTFVRRSPGDTRCINPPPSINVKPPEYVSGACTFAPPTVSLPTVTFDTVDVACGLAQVAACEARPDCVITPPPPAPFGRLCIHSPGDLPCPSEDYSVRIVGHRAVADERGCEACTGTSTGRCDPLGVRISNADCSTVTTSLQLGTCTTSPEGLDVRGVGPFDAGCKGTSVPRGAISSVDPITFCCNL